jgi:hypothetical protein
MLIKVKISVSIIVISKEVVNLVLARLRCQTFSTGILNAIRIRSEILV